jgi:adenosine deaminase
LNYGIKVTISCDDPGMFGYKDSNFDFYFAAVACEFDLLDLKLCVLNSVEGSVMEGREELKKVVLQKWDQFILEFLD